MLRGKIKRRKWFYYGFILVLSVMILIGCGITEELEGTNNVSVAENEDIYSVTDSVSMVESDQKAFDSSTSIESDSSEVISTTQKWIKTQTISVQTIDFEMFIEQLDEKVSKNNGYFEQSQIYGEIEDAGRSASYTIRIPVDYLEAFVSDIEEIATVTYTSTSTTDVTLSYVDTESYLKALRTEQDTLLKILENAGNVTDVLAVQEQLTEVRYKINTYESQLRSLDNQINYSTVYLNATKVERIAETGDGSFWDDVQEIITEKAYVLKSLGRRAAIFLLTTIPFLIPFFMLLGIAVFAIKHKKGKKKEINQEAEKKDTEE